MAVWLTFAGAILVALIAAATAEARLRKQLTHERQLADLAELRAVLDSAAIAVWRIMEAYSNCTSTLQWLHNEGLTRDHAGPDGKPVDAHRQATYEALFRLDELVMRLAIRIGSDTSLVAAIHAFRERVIEAVEAAGNLDPTKDDPEVMLDEPRRALADARDEVLSLALTFARSDVP